MIVLLTLIHVAVCLFLILVVLLQTGKGADLAGAFGGGGSQTAFGARGATTLLHKITTGSAVVFMATSLILAIMASGPSGSVVTDTGDPVAPAPVEDTAVPPGSEDGGAQPATDTGTDDEAGTDDDPGSEQAPAPEPAEEPDSDGSQEQPPDNG
jgi:preprotein translocase subunit SecG